MAFSLLARMIAHLLNMIIERKSDRGYFTKPAKSLLIMDTPGQDAAEKRDFAAEGLDLDFVVGSWYLICRHG